LGHFFEGLSAQTLADFGKTDTLGVRQAQARLELIAKDAIFRHQVFVSKAEFLVNRTGDIREHSFPIHRAKVEHGGGPSSTLRGFASLKSSWTAQFELFDPTGNAGVVGSFGFGREEDEAIVSAA
jgi:hypothetical protein